MKTLQKARFKRGSIWALLAAMVLLLIACEDGYPDYDHPPAITSTVLRPTVEAAQVEAYQASIQAQHTLDAVHAMETATAVAERQTATAEAAQQTATAIALHATASAEAARATATQGATYARATATVWQTTVEAQRAQATATAQVQQAAATATAQAESARATATTVAARATATAHVAASHATATVAMATWQMHATATKSAANAIATAQAAQAETEKLRADRQRMLQPILTYGPWGVLLALVCILGYGGFRLLRVFEDRKRVVETQRGEILIVNGARVGMPSRSWSPVLDIEVPPTRQPDSLQQDDTTRRDQITAAIRATHAPAESRGNRGGSIAQQQQAATQLLRRPPSAERNLRPFRGAPGIGRIVVLKRIDHAIQGGIVPPNLARAIEQDWQRQVVDGEYREV
jgi:hypothetical protein